MLIAGMTACSTQDKSKEKDTKKESKGEIILATTTSVQDSGLLDELLPKFTKDTGIDVKVVAVGSGKALQMGKDGEADALLVHSPADEEIFMTEGHGVDRKTIMENQFILVGPKNDPAGLSKSTVTTVEQAMQAIVDTKSTFVSRGDQSGTHTKELKLWADMGMDPKTALGDKYVEAGKGMGDVLTMASEMQGYTLTDKATFLKMEKDLDLKIVYAGKDKGLTNKYSVITVNPDKNKQINKEGANEFYKWMISESANKIIKTYGEKEFGEPLFFLVK